MLLLRHWRGFAFIASVLATMISGTLAQQAGVANGKLPIFEIPVSGVSFESGDTWRQAGETFRLYGVQSCIRGTSFTNATGVKADCGEASLAYFAALIRDTKPRCTAVARSGAPPLIYVVCAAHIGKATLDLGTVLVTQGFAFAAADAASRPVNFAYSVAEADAKAHQRGLWASPDLPLPNAILARAIRRGAVAPPLP
jgi:endonuclease YncB( thermonuclease family)